MYDSINYRMKNEVNNLIASTKNTNHGSFNHWVSSFRRPKDLHGGIDVIMNDGTTQNPKWRIFKEIDRKDVELVRMPNLLSPINNDTSYYKALSHFRVIDEKNNFLTKKNSETGFSSPFNFKSLKNVGSLFVNIITY